ncbi:MAG: ATP-binding protein [Gemmatimonadaceae bacterium]
MDAAGASRLEDLLEAVPFAIALFDEYLALVRANTRFYELLGREPGRIGVDTLSAIFPDWPADLGVPVDLAGNPDAHRPVRFALRCGEPAGDGADDGDGEVRVVEATLTPVPARGGLPRALCFVGRDVTLEVAPEGGARAADGGARIRRFEQRTQELLHLQDARARERRLAAVGQLAAGVMHDVNNALNPIMAAAHLILLDPADTEAVRDYATRIAKAAETGAATAARVGRFIRQEPEIGSHDELIDLSVIADEVIAMTRPVWRARALGAEIELRRAVADGALTRGLPSEIREALINLVQNALDSMAGAGVSTIGIATRVDNGEAVVEVSDTGHGMTTDVAERAFEPFFTTKGANGTGLGLSEVYGIVKRHRGRAEIVSSPGAGTTVRLVFPLATALTPSGEFHAFLDRVPKRVLVVDHDATSRDVVCALLVADGHVVDASTSATEALARLDATAARHGRYDLLLVAPALPDAAGSVVVDAARARWRDLRVGLVASLDGADGVVPPRADFTVAKPVRATQLLSLVAADG